MASFKRAPTPETPKEEAVDPVTSALSWLTGGDLAPRWVWILAGIAVIAALALMMRRARPAWAQSCEWKRAGEAGWFCTTCGIEVEYADGRKPRECLRDASPS